jgi:hypothetical protein
MPAMNVPQCASYGNWCLSTVQAKQVLHFRVQGRTIPGFG